MQEWNRIEQQVKSATDEQIDAWQETLGKRLFDCGFDRGRVEFSRLLSNAYLKFPQYRESICEVVGVSSDSEIARKRSLVNLVLTVIVVIVSIITLILTLWKE